MTHTEGQNFQYFLQLSTTFSYFFNLSLDRNIEWLEFYDSFMLPSCINFFQFNIQLAKKSNRRQFLILTQNVTFSFSTFLEYMHLNYVFLKLVYRPEISSRSASGQEKKYSASTGNKECFRKNKFCAI